MGLRNLENLKDDFSEEAFLLDDAPGLRVVVGGRRYPRFASYGDCPVCGAADAVRHTYDEEGWHYACSACGDYDR
jgi:predicted RNA-binding Zn-ribbon protein involved in translation (DUF1610 family)